MNNKEIEALAARVRILEEKMCSIGGSECLSRRDFNSEMSLVDQKMRSKLSYMLARLQELEKKIK